MLETRLVLLSILWVLSTFTNYSCSETTASTFEDIDINGTDEELPTFTIILSTTIPGGSILLVIVCCAACIGVRCCAKKKTHRTDIQASESTGSHARKNLPPTPRDVAKAKPPDPPPKLSSGEANLELSAVDKTHKLPLLPQRKVHSFEMENSSEHESRMSAGKRSVSSPAEVVNTQQEKAKKPSPTPGIVVEEHSADSTDSEESTEVYYSNSARAYRTESADSHEEDSTKEDSVEVNYTEPGLAANAIIPMSKNIAYKDSTITRTQASRPQEDCSVYPMENSWVTVLGSDEPFVAEAPVLELASPPNHSYDEPHTFWS